MGRVGEEWILRDVKDRGWAGKEGALAVQLGRQGRCDAMGMEMTTPHVLLYRNKVRWK
jgi:hypothetical protein